MGNSARDSTSSSLHGDVIRYFFSQKQPAQHQAFPFNIVPGGTIAFQSVLLIARVVMRPEFIFVRLFGTACKAE
jgi:hypothetical protein